MLALDWPLAFVLLPLPLLVLWLVPEYRDESEAVRAPFFRRLVELTGRLPSEGAVVIRKRNWQKLYHVVGWVVVVSALARPVWVADPIEKQLPARDLLLIVDLSGSMEERDFTDALGERISRLDAVKQVVSDFVERRESDRIALAVFGQAAFLQAPFTEDRQVIEALLDELVPRMAGAQTMIGDAIGLAVRLFEGSDKENKVAILLTDGNDTGSKMPVARAARIAGEDGIKIHTIAIGDPQTVGEKAIDEEALEGVARTTGGRSFLALDRAELASVYDELDRLEPEKIDTLSYRPREPLYWMPLAFLLGFAVLLFNVMLRLPGIGAPRRAR
ncbi:MAG: VWA domain-containing protein [Myxococcota bacterium]|nr:VWA domain-containing protein [Myxococcota bacterium]